MKRLISVIMVVCMVCITMICSGCGNKLPEQYKAPDMSFKGLDLECMSGGNNHNMVRNDMVYKDFEKFVIADQAEKGNEIESIMISESTGEPYHETQTVAIMNVEIEAKGGDITSGQYYIAAYFTYDTSKPEDVKMYLINYCFVDDYEVNEEKMALFDECYEKVKDQFKSK